MNDPVETAAMLAETTISRNGHEIDMPESEMRHIWENAKQSGLADVQLAKYRLFLTAYLSALAHEGLVLVPSEITEDMADAMECEFSTEGQWQAALAAAPDALAKDTTT